MLKMTIIQCDGWHWLKGNMSYAKLVKSSLTNLGPFPAMKYTQMVSLYMRPSKNWETADFDK